MNRRELEAGPALAVRVTFEAGRMSANHLADAYELIIPPIRRMTVASCRHQLFNRGRRYGITRGHEHARDAGAIYARVSSEQQANAHTVASQLAALRQRGAADGFRLLEDREFIDEGYSGASLVRPELELLHRFENGDDLRVGLKPYLQAA